MTAIPRLYLIGSQVIGKKVLVTSSDLHDL